MKEEIPLTESFRNFAVCSDAYNALKKEETKLLEKNNEYGKSFARKLEELLKRKGVSIEPCLVESVMATKTIFITNNYEGTIGAYLSFYIKGFTFIVYFRMPCEKKLEKCKNLILNTIREELDDDSYHKGEYRVKSFLGRIKDFISDKIVEFNKRR